MYSLNLSGFASSKSPNWDSISQWRHARKHSFASLRSGSASSTMQPSDSNIFALGRDGLPYRWFPRQSEALHHGDSHSFEAPACQTFRRTGRPTGRSRSASADRIQRGRSRIARNRRHSAPSVRRLPASTNPIAQGCLVPARATAGARPHCRNLPDCAATLPYRYRPQSAPCRRPMRPRFRRSCRRKFSSHCKD